MRRWAPVARIPVEPGLEPLVGEAPRGEWKETPFGDPCVLSGTPPSAPVDERASELTQHLEQATPDRGAAKRLVEQLESHAHGNAIGRHANAEQPGDGVGLLTRKVFQDKRGPAQNKAVRLRGAGAPRATAVAGRARLGTPRVKPPP